MLPPGKAHRPPGPDSRLGSPDAKASGSTVVGWDFALLLRPHCKPSKTGAAANSPGTVTRSQQAQEELHYTVGQWLQQPPLSTASHGAVDIQVPKKRSWSSHSEAGVWVNF